MTIARRDLALGAAALFVGRGARARAGAPGGAPVPGVLSKLHININQAPFDNLKVRQAVAHAIDRDALARLGPPAYRAATSCVPAGIDLPLAPCDLAQARLLLREAGYPDGFAVRIIHTERPDMLATIRMVQGQLQRAGIVLEIDVVEHAAFHEQIRRNMSPLVHYVASSSVENDDLAGFYHSRSIVGTPGAIANFSHTDIADAEIDAALASSDVNERRRLMATAQRKLLAQVCVVPLVETWSGC
jgi:peptide/nickel transport system substrate-binding protein